VNGAWDDRWRSARPLQRPQLGGGIPGDPRGGGGGGGAACAMGGGVGRRRGPPLPQPDAPTMHLRNVWSEWDDGPTPWDSHHGGTVGRRKRKGTPPPQGSKRTPAIRFHTNKAERGKGLQKYMRMPSATTPRLPRVVGTCPKNSRGGRTRKCEKSGTVHCWAGFALGLLRIDSSITTSHVPSFDVT